MTGIGSAFISDPFWIMEYQTIDSLGRGKEWLYAGIAKNQEEVMSCRREIETKLNGKRYDFRAHQYSHQLGPIA